MRRTIILTVAVLVASSRQSEAAAVLPSVDLQMEFDQGDLSSSNGVIVVQKGSASFSASRDSRGLLSGGVGLYETGELPLGTLGKISLRATTTVDGMYRALLDTELYTGSSAMNPLTLTLSNSGQGIEYSGASDLGLLGGTFIASTRQDSRPEFEVHLNTNGWLTAVARGNVQKGSVVVETYEAGLDLGLLSGAVHLNEKKELQSYELGGSLGLVHGTVTTDTTGKRPKGYKMGLSLGVVSFDKVTEPDGTASYSTVIDTGIIRFVYNVNRNNKSSWKGLFNLPNFAMNYELAEDGSTIAGGRIHIGSSAIDITRDNTGHFIVKMTDGEMVQ